MPRLALYEPDIAPNVGAIMRLCACMEIALDIIEPCGFPWNPAKIRKGALDYYDHVSPALHQNWGAFQTAHAGRRKVLLTTKTDLTYINFNFEPDDILIAGSESAGVPDHVHHDVDAVITIPMANDMRSLNVGMSCAIILSEAKRQIDGR